MFQKTYVSEMHVTPLFLQYMCVCLLMALGYDRERCLHDPVKKVRQSLRGNRRTERVSQREN